MESSAHSSASDSPPNANRTLFVAGLAVLATFLDTTILFVAFPAIGATFSEASNASLSWVLNAYAIMFGALLIPAGKLADRVGHRKSFLTGSALFTGASMICGLAPSIELLIAFRVLQAVGAAVLIPSSFALVMRAFPPEKIPQAIAIWGALGALAGAVGPTLGAAIVQYANWRWAFFLNLPVGIFTIWAGQRTLHESADPATKVPAAAGVALIAGAAAFVSYGVVESDNVGWLSTRTIVVLALGFALLGGFVAHQRRTSAPALDLDLFSIGNIRWGVLTAFVYGLAFSAMFFGSIQFLTSVWDWSTLAAGAGISPGPLMVAMLAPKAGKLAAQYGQRPLLLAGGFFFACGGFHRLLFLTDDVSYLVTYFPSMIFTGVGVACILPQLSSVVAQALPKNRVGVGGALLQAVRQFGATFGIAAAIALLGTPDSFAERLASFDRIWWIIVAGGLGTSLLALPLRTGPTATTAPTGPTSATPAKAS